MRKDSQLKELQQRLESGEGCKYSSHLLWLLPSRWIAVDSSSPTTFVSVTMTMAIDCLRSAIDVASLTQFQIFDRLMRSSYLDPVVTFVKPVQ